MSDRTTIVVSIGRNIGGTPMDARTWEDFIEAATNNVEALAGDIVGRARGKGEWDGGSEDNFVLIALFPTTLLHVLRDWFAGLAWVYRQDTIGLVVHNDGTNSLVEAR